MNKIMAILNVVNLVLYIIFLVLNKRCWKSYTEKIKRRENRIFDTITKEYKELEDVIKDIYIKSDIPFKERKRVLDKYNDIGAAIVDSFIVESDEDYE